MRGSALEMNAADAADAVAIAHGLKRYALTEDGVEMWVVSGVSSRSGKRWRRRFASKETADEFFERMLRRAELVAGAESKPDTGADRGGDSKSRRSGASTARGRWRGLASKAVIVLLVVGASFAIDLKSVGRKRLREEAQRAVSDFQANPSLTGWQPSATGAWWREVEAGAGEKALAMGDGSWVSPPLGVRPFSWYRVGFRTRQADERVKSVASAQVEFTVPGSRTLRSDTVLPVRVESGWLANDFRVRVPGLGNDGGKTGSLLMRCRFSGAADAAWLADDFITEPVSETEVAHWADILYARLGATLQNRPRASRWTRLPETLRRLRDHQKLRIAFAGGEAMRHLAATPIDIFIRRMYPGAIVEVVGPVGTGSSPMAVREWLELVTPDLIVFGGSNDEAARSTFATLHEALKVRNEATGVGAEMLVLSDGWVRQAGRMDELLIHSGMRELDQDPAENLGAPDDYRADWMKIAASRQVEFLDAMGILSEFVFGPAVVAKVGPATASDGVPYQFRLRDWLNAEETGRQVMARILENYFRPPDPGSLAAPARSRQAAVRLFDPENNARDRAMLEEVRTTYQPARMERAVLAVTYPESVFQRAQKSVDPLGRFRVQDQAVREVALPFDEPVDVRKGDLAVYWSFRADRSKGEEAGKVTLHLAYAGEDRSAREERAQLSFTVRPGASAILGVQAEFAGVEELEHEVEVPVENFTDPTRAARFRLLVRWGGADRVVAEVASWNPRTRRWESYVPFDRPGAPPLVMEMSITEHLLGSSFFRSIYFEAQSDVPFLESVLVTTRPSILK